MIAHNRLSMSGLALKSAFELLGYPERQIEWHCDGHGHRHNPNDTIDSNCCNCIQTIATESSDAQLRARQQCHDPRSLLSRGNTLPSGSSGIGRECVCCSFRCRCILSRSIHNLQFSEGGFDA
jgi:hypothetical protein